MKKIRSKLINGIFYGLCALLMLSLLIIVLILWNDKTLSYSSVLAIFYLGALWAYCTIFSVGNFVRYADLRRQKKEIDQHESDST